MGEISMKMCSFLHLIFIIFWMSPCVHSENNVGCLFSPNVCEKTEECFDDNAFGLCQFAFGDDNDQYHHFLKSDTIHLLEKEFTRLFAGGYRWRHEYTQCVVQNILYSSRHKIFYDPGLCSRIMQFTLPDVPPDILLDIETPDPEELAFIKFKPNRKDSDGTMFAEELFTPPIFSERQSEEDENETPESDPETHWLHEYRNKRFPTRPEETPLAGKKDVLRELIKTAEDTGKLLNGIRENSDRYSDNDMQIKSDFPSGLNQKEALREGSIEFLPIEDNEFPEDELLDPFDKKRVVQLTDHYNSQDQDTHPIVKISSDQENPSAQKSGYNADEEIPTFGRIRGEDNEDVNFRWNAKHRTKFMDDDLTRFAKGDPARQERVKNLNLEPESTDNNNLSDVIENDYLEDQLYAIFPTAKGMPTFTRDMRYDTKKPGPTYMLHDDEDGDTSHDDEEMAGQEIDRFLSHLTQNVEHNQLLSLLKSPVGVHKSYNTFVPNFEVTDETRRIFVTSGIPSMPEEVFGSKDGSVKLPERQQSFERPPADQPELLEGIDDEKSKEVRGDEEKPTNAAKTGEGHVGHYDNVASTHTYLLIKEKNIGEEKAQELVDTLIKMLGLPKNSFSNIKLEGRQITFKVNPNALNMNASEVATKAEEHSSHLRELTGLTIEAAGIGDKVKYEVINPEKDKRMFIIAFALCGAVAGVVLAAGTAYLVRRHTRSREKLHNMTQPDTEASQDYQDLCRQRMASKANEKPEPVHTVHSPKKIRSLSQEGQASSSSHSSTSSWNEEPVTSNMDISTGHMILSYMEDHLKNKDRLDKEWEALCAYEAELCATTAASQPTNIKKNRYTDVLPYDHSRVVLNELSNVSSSDYINSSSITDHDPRNPAYIATQGPLPQTASDFWQMIWEQGSVVIVMLSRLMENGVAMCHRYWPEEGSEVYHIYEVHLVSEHIWCDDYLVRSFYLKNLRTSETRTVTQFHFMSWPDNGVPNSTKALLEFRRKVNKSYRGRSCPIVVHCSDGIGRTGTYCLIDMVLNRMSKGAKEIDIAATLEHVRDQRCGMVKTKAQFEFVLMAIAEEVHAILKALSQ